RRHPRPEARPPGRRRRRPARARDRRTRSADRGRAGRGSGSHGTDVTHHRPIHPRREGKTMTDQTMTDHRIGTREEWLAARRELLDAEKELTRRSDDLARRRQELPWVRIEKEYRFETDEGGATLQDLFRGRSQLLVYHFMFGPEYT